MKIIQRKEAQLAGLKRYFTNKPCVRGHISERITANGCCHSCILEDKKTKRSKKPGYKTREELDARRDSLVRICTTCGKSFPSTTEHFVLLKKGDWRGLSAECRECRNDRFSPYYKKNKKRLIKRITKYIKKRRLDPSFKIKDRKWARECAQRRFTDPVQRAIATKRNRLWRKKNPKRVKRFKHNHPAMKRMRAMNRYAAQSRPLWVDKKKIETIYRIADYLTQKTGIKYEVDHIYPLVHPLCSGLHVPWNLRVITAKANQTKGNRLPNIGG
jgi:5-methylcytosine-specific restriction endonuclease McrA